MKREARTGVVHAERGRGRILDPLCGSGLDRGDSVAGSLSGVKVTCPACKLRRPKPVSARRWVRDGTLVGKRSTEIDLRRGTGERADWITIKGASDARSEALAAKLLAVLNRRAP